MTIGQLLHLAAALGELLHSAYPCFILISLKAGGAEGCEYWKALRDYGIGTSASSLIVRSKPRLSVKRHHKIFQVTV